MSEAELKEYRRHLLALRRQLSGKIRDIEGGDPPPLEADSGSPDTLTDSADKSVHEYEEQVDRTLVGNEERILVEVDAALGRVDAGTFGRCETCGRQISTDRLKAIPYARQCIVCARQGETASGRP